MTKIAQYKICIDPGHGGKDPGAIGPSGTKEKDITLAIALKLKPLLENRGIEIYLTRTADIFVDLSIRAKMANEAHADYFVSIHCNSAINPQAHGIETYCYVKSEKAEKLANMVQSEIVKATGLMDRGVKTANFAVLRETKMPAILIETAFISNINEEKLFKNVVFQDKIAIAIAKGLCRYLGIEYMGELNMEEIQEVSSWAKEAWEWGREKGITDGTRPKDAATREEIVTMLYRMNGGK